MVIDTSSSPEIALLRRSAVVDLDSDATRSIAALAPKIDDWKELVVHAEKHGLSNLLFGHLNILNIAMPAAARQQFLALKIRHRRANLARIKAMQEIVDTFNQQKIDSALLKGAALLHVLYPLPELRPMGDIDILVSPQQIDQAQQCLRDLGYTAEDRKSGFLADHHHLPVASRTIDDVPIYVEIHRDALSGDVNDSIRLDTLSAPLTEFEIGDTKCRALGHIDMLRHLCHHTLEPIDEIKLVAIADIYGYACRYRDKLDVQVIDARYPFVANFLTLLHYLTPLPGELRGWISVPSGSPPHGVGCGYTPMSLTLERYKNPFMRLTKLLQAPDWWLHGFYGVPPGQSLLPTKFASHPMRVTSWLFRRLRAKHRGVDQKIQ